MQAGVLWQKKLKPRTRAPLIPRLMELIESNASTSGGRSARSRTSIFRVEEIGSALDAEIRG